MIFDATSPRNWVFSPSKRGKLTLGAGAQLTVGGDISIGSNNALKIIGDGQAAPIITYGGAMPNNFGSVDYNGTVKTWAQALTPFELGGAYLRTEDNVTTQSIYVCDCDAATAAAIDALCLAGQASPSTSRAGFEAVVDGILATQLPANGCALDGPCRDAILTAMGL